MVDTNSDPNLVDYAIPCNDDAAKSIALVVNTIAKAIEEGLSERKVEKDKDGAAKDKQVAPKKEARTSARKSTAKKEETPVEKDEEVTETKIEE